MTREIDSDRPNYKLVYRLEFRDDNFEVAHFFKAYDNAKAGEIAAQFIKEKQVEYEANRKRDPQRYDGCWYKPTSLIRLNYVMREVIEETLIPLQPETAVRGARRETADISTLARE